MTIATRQGRLWAPWRMEYIRAAEAAGNVSGGKRAARRAPEREPSRSLRPRRGCLFCRLARVADDRNHFVLARRPKAFMMLNRFPYNPAHLMVAASRHAARVSDLSPEEREDMLELTALAERALAAEYHPHGMNLGANLGRVAGAGYPDHLHLHLVPRWNGDTNFMPTIGETKVLPESLSRTWTRLRRALAALEPEASRAGRHRARRR